MNRFRMRSLKMSIISLSMLMLRCSLLAATALLVSMESVDATSKKGEFIMHAIVKKAVNALGQTLIRHNDGDSMEQVE